MKAITATAAALTICACAAQPTFKLSTTADKFDPKQQTEISGTGNRISKKSVAGGVHVDDKGMNINPVLKRAPDGTISTLYLHIEHNTQISTIQGQGSLLGNPQSLAFIADGTIITLQVAGGRSVFGSTYMQGQFAYTPVIETGVAPLTPEQLKKIATATSLEAKVTGSKVSVTYSSNELDPAFRPNLQRFIQAAAL